MPSASSQRESDQPPEEPRCLAPGDVAPNEVRAQLERILASEIFVRSPQLSRFLRYAVEDALTNSGLGLKEYEIARQVFHKPEHFDVRLDPIVRVEARRLRSRLVEYYAGEGKDDAVSIDFGKRGYKPKFSIRSNGPETEPATPSAALEQGTAIAVLPFLDLTEAGDQQYFCDGLTEELIHALTRLPGLLVASRSSSFQFKGGGQDVRRVGADLGVATVMEGSVRRQGKRLRVTAQLTSADTGFHLWSETYDAELEDLFDVQESISSAIVDTVRKQKRVPAVPLLQRKQTERPEAYRDFLRGLHLQRSPLPADLLRSETHLTAAVEADSQYTGAIAALARTRVKLVWHMVRSPEEGWPLAKSSAESALAIDPGCAVAHAALASARAAGDWNWPEAEKAFRLALAAGENEAIVRQAWAVHYLSPLGRLDDALAEMTAAVELAPHSLESWADLAWVRFFRGEFGEAADQFQGILNDKPDHANALLGLARCYLEQDQPERALQVLGIALQIEDSPQMQAALAMAHTKAGQAIQAAPIAAALATPGPARYVSPLLRAQVAAAMERFDEAVAHLHDAVQVRCPRLVEIDIDPVFRPLHASGLAGPIRVAVCLAPSG